MTSSWRLRSTRFSTAQPRARVGNATSLIRWTRRRSGGRTRGRSTPGRCERPRRRRSLTLRSRCPVGDARLNKLLGCFGPRVETDLPEHFAVLLGVHVVVPKRAISIKKIGCDGLDRCGQFVEQCSRLQVCAVLWVLGSFGAPPVGGLLKVQSQRLLISSSVILCPPARGANVPRIARAMFQELGEGTDAAANHLSNCH
jgi:hypothetical protein